MLTQEMFLLPGAIADSLRLRRPDATDEQVRAATAAVGEPEDRAAFAALYRDAHGLSADGEPGR
ncbi:MAG: hypothetical protein QM677_11485 [Microbacterium sp.]